MSGTAEVHAIGRAPGRDVLECGPLRLDPSGRALTVDGRTVRLSHREFLLLQHLISRADSVCSREELLAEVWGYRFDPGTNVVDVYIRRVRQKLQRDQIATVRTVGYSLRSA